MTPLLVFFAPDMPPAAAEAVSEDFAVLASAWVEPGGSAELTLPDGGAAAYVRVRMPSGRMRTVPTGGREEVTVTRAAPDDRPVFRHIGDPTPAGGAASIGEPDRLGAETSDAFSVRLVDAAGETVEPSHTTPGDWSFALGGGREPLDLEVAADVTVCVRLPGALTLLDVHRSPADGRLFSAAVTTQNPEADTIGSYLHRGDLGAASSILPTWEAQARRMLGQKVAAPGPATVGAYLLLRTRRFQLMRDWTRNLANWSPDLTDGAVIWAWQCVHEGRADEARTYLHRASEPDAPLPVYSEGLRLLADGLRLLGDDGVARLRALEARLGYVFWESPFTAYAPQGVGTGRPQIDVGYAAARTPVESTAFETVGYDRERQRLLVEFDSEGRVYAFEDVPEAVYDAFREAESLGGYFNQFIRGGGYRSVRIR